MYLVSFFFCIINFSITIFLSLVLPPLLSLLFLCYNMLFSFPTTVSAPSHWLCHPVSPSSPILPQPVTTLPSLQHTHHLLISLLYQLYTIPAPCNPWHKHPPLQQKYTQTCTKATKPSSPYTSSLSQKTLSHAPFLCHLYQLPKSLYLAW
jgi:hypothetical protein